MPPPVLSRLDPPVAQVGAPDVTLRVVGTGFAPDAVIVWNGADEPTVNVSAGEVTTIVAPSTASGPLPVPVLVRNGPDTSNVLTFTFTADPPAPPYCTVDDVRARLRTVVPADEGYLARCVGAANALVDTHLYGDDVEGVASPVTRRRWRTEAPWPWPRWDPETAAAATAWPRVTAPYPDPVWRAAVGVSMRIFRFKDVESDVANAWTDSGVLHIPRDPLAGYVDILAPYRDPSQWAPA